MNAPDNRNTTEISTVATAPRHVRRRYTAPLVATAVVIALLAAGVVPRLHASAALTRQTESVQVLNVSVVMPKTAPAEQELLLPGSAMPYADAAIYARTSGYIAYWSADIGAQVKAGSVLATIQTPELDAQLQQARADLALAQSNYAYAQTTAQRWQGMLKTQSVSQQDTDMKVSDMQAKQAMLASAQAYLARLSEMVSYEKVTAPFDGTVTARNVDVGTLVTAGGTPGSSGMSGELFHLEQTSKLRVFVDVPQDAAPFAVPGTQVFLTTQQYPGRHFVASVVRNDGSIDPVSRTMRVEVDVDNADHALLPGAYIQVHLQLHTTPALDLPVSALLFRPDGVTVAVVGADNKVQLKTVQIGRDFGTHLEITTGLAATDRVIDNPGDSIMTGQAVHIVAATHS